MKTCSDCGDLKDGEEFYKDSRYENRLMPRCKVCQNKRTGNNHRKNRVREAIQVAQYAKQHPEVQKKKWIKWFRSHPNARIAASLRLRIRKAVRRDLRVGSAVRDLGCSIPELKLRLESKFQPGMSWDNYGEWHIDHIKPLAKFDLTDRKQFLEACHYTNLQPLWAKDNLRKGSHA